MTRFAGEIYELTIYLRPYPAVTVLRNMTKDLGQKTGTLLGKDYWELPRACPGVLSESSKSVGSACLKSKNQRPTADLVFGHRYSQECRRPNTRALLLVTHACLLFVWSLRQRSRFVVRCQIVARRGGCDAEGGPRLTRRAGSRYVHACPRTRARTIELFRPRPDTSWPINCCDDFGLPSAPEVSEPCR